MKGAASKVATGISTVGVFIAGVGEAVPTKISRGKGTSKVKKVISDLGSGVWSATHKAAMGGSVILGAGKSAASGVAEAAMALVLREENKDIENSVEEEAPHSTPSPLVSGAKTAAAAVSARARKVGHSLQRAGSVMWTAGREAADTVGKGARAGLSAIKTLGTAVDNSKALVVPVGPESEANDDLAMSIGAAVLAPFRFCGRGGKYAVNTVLSKVSPIFGVGTTVAAAPGALRLKVRTWWHSPIPVLNHNPGTLIWGYVQQAAHSAEEHAWDLVVSALMSKWFWLAVLVGAGVYHVTQLPRYLGVFMAIFARYLVKYLGSRIWVLLKTLLTSLAIQWLGHPRAAVGAEADPTPPPSSEILPLSEVEVANTQGPQPSEPPPMQLPRNEVHGFQLDNVDQGQVPSHPECLRCIMFDSSQQQTPQEPQTPQQHFLPEGVPFAGTDTHFLQSQGGNELGGGLGEEEVEETPSSPHPEDLPRGAVGSALVLTRLVSSDGATTESPSPLQGRSRTLIAPLTSGETTHSSSTITTTHTQSTLTHSRNRSPDMCHRHMPSNTSREQ